MFHYSLNYSNLFHFIHFSRRNSEIKKYKKFGNLGNPFSTLGNLLLNAVLRLEQQVFKAF